MSVGKITEPMVFRWLRMYGAIYSEIGNRLSLGRSGHHLFYSRWQMAIRRLGKCLQPQFFNYILTRKSLTWIFRILLVLLHIRSMATRQLNNNLLRNKLMEKDIKFLYGSQT